MKTMSFINATRQNIRPFGKLQFEPNQRKSQDLPRTGLLANVFVRVSGKLKVTPGTGSAVLKANQHGKPFNLIDRIRLVANSGTEIVNVTGMGLYLRNLIAESAVLDVPAVNLQDAVAGNPVYQFGTASGDNQVDFFLKVPIVVNDRDPLGMILLQNGETLISMHIDWANPSSLFTISGNATVEFVGDAHLTYEYYSVPLSKDDYPDLSIAHTILEDVIDINGTGDTTYTVPRGNIYQRMIHRVYLNDAPAGFDDIDYLTLQYNQSETPYRYGAKDLLGLQRMKYKRDLPKGVFVHDWSYQGIAGLGGNRDLVNSKAITDFLSLITVGNGAVLGTNNNKLMTVREQLVPLI